MKAFCSILAIYMMAVFLTPCADMDQKEVFEKDKHSTEFAHEGSHDHAGEIDYCSPFCVCNCCGGTVLSTVLKWNIYGLVKDSSFDLPTPQAYYKSLFVTSYFNDIWQPPQITV